MSRSVKLLVVDDDTTHRNTLLTLLADWRYCAQGVDNGAEAVELCRQSAYDLVLMDVRMAGLDGIDAMGRIKAYNPAIPVLVMTAFSDVDTAVRALKAGAYDYLTKPLDFDELRLTLERALEHADLRVENRTLKNALEMNQAARELVGKSPSMRRLLDMLAAIAPSDATVLVTGESGTGKELTAKLVHASSPRRDGPFVAINCAALSESLLESELFGHEKGAFTGADRQREGRFRAADTGTIFLDEIGEMPLAMQVKLLRAIQEREVQRVGGDATLKVDVRIIAATNRDLRREVEEGRFREDLFYRLNVVNVLVPPLRERVEDIPILADRFLCHFAEKNGKLVKGFTPAAMDRLLKYAWPGNVRELENTVERAVVLLMGEYVGERELPPALLEVRDDGPAPKYDSATMTLEDMERAAVQEAVEQCGGNKSEAARRLGITRKTLQTKLQK